MEDDPIFFENGRRHKFYWKMEDVLNYKKMEDDLNSKLNGRRPQVELP